MVNRTNALNKTGQMESYIGTARLTVVVFTTPQSGVLDARMASLEGELPRWLYGEQCGGVVMVFLLGHLDGY
jgi:hypothetical protein